MARLNSTDNIIRRADALVRSTGTRDPERIAEALGIIVMDVNFEKQKGLYKVILRNRFIFIKSDLSEVMRRIVLLHEIGHDQLHRHLDDVFQEFQIFDMRGNVMEYEANLFAANFLIDDEELLEACRDGRDIVSIASSFGVNVNMVALKLAEMKKAGLPLNLPFTPDRRFLGRIEDRPDSV